MACESGLRFISRINAGFSGWVCLRGVLDRLLVRLLVGFQTHLKINALLFHVMLVTDDRNLRPRIWQVGKHAEQMNCGRAVSLIMAFRPKAPPRLPCISSNRSQALINTTRPRTDHQFSLVDAGASSRGFTGTWRGSCGI